MKKLWISKGEMERKGEKQKSWKRKRDRGKGKRKDGKEREKEGKE